MTPVVRSTGIALVFVFLAGACVQVGHIQQTTPVRTMNFTGSAKTVAHCIQQRFQGKVMQESFTERYVIYNAVKGDQATDGITHYSITVAQTGANQGTAEWRVVVPRDDTPMAGKPPSTRRASTLGFPESTVQKYWPPVEACAAQAAKSTS
jgi:hypothetical protein